ncbi:hypothetical protein [Streptomyces xanthophaeus]|uniref:hypothetical protein n=1 Tax=Streptomyces xanthophaeus TaxID=67385 RepID=UPI00365D8264
MLGHILLGHGAPYIESPDISGPATAVSAGAVRPAVSVGGSHHDGAPDGAICSGPLVHAVTNSLRYASDQGTAHPPPPDLAPRRGVPVTAGPAPTSPPAAYALSVRPSPPSSLCPLLQSWLI